MTATRHKTSSESDRAGIANGHDLEVVRVSSRSGFWLWRSAVYKVYQRGTDERDKVVLT